MTKTITRMLLVIPCLALTTPLSLRAAEEPPKTYVVLVGIDEYADKQIKPRKHAEADVKALYDLLTDSKYLGVDPTSVRLLLGKPDEKRKSEPATQENIMKALRWAAKAGRDDLVIVGLFMQGAPKGERACYLASDSTFKDRAKNAVAAPEIEQELGKMKSQRFCAFVDVDFKGFDAGKDASPDVNLVSLYREFIGKDDDDSPPPGRVVFLANTGLRPSIELEDHGLFAKVVLDGLSGKADKEGYEPDGQVTIDEMIDWLDKEMSPLVRKHGATKEDKEQTFHVLGSRESHFILSHNPEVMAKVRERLEKFAKLVKEAKLPKDIAEEGNHLLSRMPKLEAQRKLRKNYQALVDGSKTSEDFLKDRKKIQEGMKFSRADALTFAAKIIQATQQVKEGYVKDIHQGDLIGWAIKGIYQRIDEKIPPELTDTLHKVKDMKEEELTRLLADVREKLGNREDLDNHKDIDFALQRMLSHLDPYTTYIDPETLERFRESTEATFTGIGIQIRKDTARDQLLVVSPIKGGPSYEAGIKAGDVITQIKLEMDNKGKPIDPPEIIPTKGLPLTDAVKKIKGPPDTKVKITVEREGEKKPLEFEITRRAIEVETVLGIKRKDDDTWNYVIDPANRICYMRITQFSTNTARDVAEVLIKLEKKGIKGFILDLRFNPGGLLSSAVTISDLFVDDGLIVSVRPRIGKESSYQGESEASLTNFPMVVMVNSGSASGSEIVGGCLQDHKRALIVGERSYGKGSVQNIQNFEGGKLKMTTASFWRPSNRNLNKSSTSGKEEEDWGVIPDRVVKLTVKEREDLSEYQHDSEVIDHREPKPKEGKTEFKDKQLDTALEYLRDQIKLAAKVVKKAG